MVPGVLGGTPRATYLKELEREKREAVGREDYKLASHIQRKMDFELEAAKAAAVGLGRRGGVP